MQKPLIAVLLAGAFFSQGAQAADLLQVYQQALANDATYASARASAQAGRERVPQGRAGLLPTIAASEPNRVSHSWWPSTTTGGAPTASSAGWRPRPEARVTPTVEK